MTIVKAKAAALLREAAQVLSDGRVSAAAVSPKGYTIYFTGVYGIDKKEAKSIEEVTKSGLDFVEKRGRRVKTIMSYYAPFILVIEGTNLPDPADAFESPSTDGKGTTTQKGPCPAPTHVGKKSC